VIGAGRIGRRHAELIASSRRATLAAIVDPAAEVARLARELEAPWFPALDRLLQADAPDGAIVATPNALHREHAELCLGAGIPVLVEKPIATTVADGLRLAASAERHAVPLLVGHHRRHSPLLSAARGVVARGTLGTVVAASAITAFSKPAAYFDAAPWRLEPGGGPILINLIHDVDALRMLAGEVVSVQAVASSGVRGNEAEESVAATLRFAGGAVGSMLLSDAAAAPLSWEMTSGEDRVYPRYPDRDCYVVAGTHGTLGIPTLRLTTADGPPSWHEPMWATVLDVPPADPLVRQLDHFCDVIAGEAAPLAGGRDAVETLRVTLAIAEAAASGRTVDCAPTAADPSRHRP
jgi:predicted dehydrogenase